MMQLQVTHEAPTFWSGAYDTKPSPAPIYGRAMDAIGNPLEIDTEVLVTCRLLSTSYYRGKIVAIGDEGLPDCNVAKLRPYASAVLISVGTENCEPHSFDEYRWLQAETDAASDMARKGVDLARCIYGGFYFEAYQRSVIRKYLGYDK